MTRRRIRLKHLRDRHSRRCRSLRRDNTPLGRNTDLLDICLVGLELCLGKADLFRVHVVHDVRGAEECVAEDELDVVGRGGDADCARGRAVGHGDLLAVAVGGDDEDLVEGDGDVGCVAEAEVEAARCAADRAADDLPVVFVGDGVEEVVELLDHVFWSENVGGSGVETGVYWEVLGR